MAKKSTDINQNKDKKKPGLPKGRTNNPNGRPKGAKNKVPNQVKSLLEDWTIDNFEKFKKDYNDLPPLERAKLYEKISGRFIPRPMNEEEENASKKFESEFMNRLFGKKSEN